MLELPTGRMQVLWPQAEKVRRDADLNDFCLVTLWELGEARLLSMSDLPGTYEPYVATPADVLKVGHHGQADKHRQHVCADCRARGGAGFRGAEPGPGKAVGPLAGDGAVLDRGLRSRDPAIFRQAL